MTATDRLNHDGTVTIWQWQRKIGDKWSPVLLPCTGDGYKKPLHDKRWAKFYDTWQKHGVHGFESEADALACLEMVVTYIRHDDGTRPALNQPRGRGKEHAWSEWRLAKITMSLATSTVMTGCCTVNPRKPNKRTVTRIARETAKHLRDLVAAFCRARDGVEIKERHVTKDFGTFGASWRVPTQYGAWIVHEPSDPCTGLVSINTRLSKCDHRGDERCFEWNHNAVVDASTDPAQFAATFILDLDHRSKFLFLPRELETPRSDERSAPSATRRRERALPSAALGDKVGGKRRAAPARVVRNDEHGVLPQDVADVSGEARRLGDERRAPTPVELRTVDVDGEAGLALAKKHTRRRRNGVADEVFVGGSGNDRGGLCRVDRPTQRRAGEGLALAKADDNADRARRHRLSEPSEAGRRSTTTEAHVRSVTRERAAFKKWAAPDYVIVWFDGPSRVRLTIERFADAADALVAAGWKEMDGGRFRRTTTLKALPQVLMRVGELLAEKGSAP